MTQTMKKILLLAGVVLLVGCASATDSSPGSNKKPSSPGWTTDLTPAEVQERLALRKKLQQTGFVCNADGICSKESISIKDLKAVLEITDLKEARPAPSTPPDTIVYGLKLKGGWCVITAPRPEFDILDDKAIISVHVNTALRK